MRIDFLFIINSIAMGVALAMDAFSVSLANGLNEPHMKKHKLLTIAGTFAGFQIAMPLIGWVCVHTIVTLFNSFQKFIPWIALGLLGYIGGRMLIEGIKGEESEQNTGLGIKGLMIQGVATSIDALSVGFTIADYDVLSAVTEAVIIGVVTFAICVVGILLGKKFGTGLSGKATILGGAILLAIGLEIFIKGVFF